MNTIAEKIIADLADLPIEMQSETLDFVQFLKAKLANNQLTTEKKLNDLALAEKPKSSLMSSLKQIKIKAPEDFSENVDDYLNGEKHV